MHESCKTYLTYLIYLILLILSHLIFNIASFWLAFHIKEYLVIKTSLRKYVMFMGNFTRVIYCTAVQEDPCKVVGFTIC